MTQTPRSPTCLLLANKKAANRIRNLEISTRTARCAIIRSSRTQAVFPFVRYLGGRQVSQEVHSTRVTTRRTTRVFAHTNLACIIFCTFLSAYVTELLWIQPSISKHTNTPIPGLCRSSPPIPPQQHGGVKHLPRRSSSTAFRKQYCNQLPQRLPPPGA